LTTARSSRTSALKSAAARYNRCRSRRHMYFTLEIAVAQTVAQPSVRR
jgi:hypothetical protein